MSFKLKDIMVVILNGKHIIFFMQSLLYLLWVKENYYDWSVKIKHTFIFKELWNGICEGEGDNAPKNLTSDNELSIWENKNKAYALIATSVNEKVSLHISPFSNTL